MSLKKIIIITAPSGAGKTSIVKHLLKEYPEKLAFSISATTRQPRANEINGTDYYFISLAEFNKKINALAFIEWEMVYEGKYYGTLKADIERIWKNGKTPVLDIDVKGAIHVQQQFKKDALSIFIEPPSVETLSDRLKNRGSETAASIKARVDKASYEITFKKHFDIIIVNDILDIACEKAEDVIMDFLKTN
jgi:guanylate kinase